MATIDRMDELENENETLLDALQLLQHKERECEILWETLRNVESIVTWSNSQRPKQTILSEIAKARVKIQVLEDETE